MNEIIEKMRYRILFLTLSLLSFIGCSDQYDYEAEKFSEQANAKLSLLRNLCENGCYNITSDIVCVGRVTSSDKEGNFYRSIFIEDDSGAVELLLGTYNTSSQFPVGLLVALRLNGTAVMRNGRVIQVGLPPQNHNTTPREMEAWAVIDKYVVRSESIAPTSPKKLNIADLDSSNCGEFIEISNISHPSQQSDNGKIKGYVQFTDSDKKRIYTYVMSSANFADMAIPSGTISVKGILMHEAVGGNAGRQYVIRPRSKDDFTIIDSAN